MGAVGPVCEHLLDHGIATIQLLGLQHRERESVNTRWKSHIGNSSSMPSAAFLFRSRTRRPTGRAGNRLSLLRGEREAWDLGIGYPRP